MSGAGKRCGCASCEAAFLASAAGVHPVWWHGRVFGGQWADPAWLERVLHEHRSPHAAAFSSVMGRGRAVSRYGRVA